MGYHADNAEDTTEQPLTCITCRMLFSSSLEQKLHYKTDFHRFNLKRKVAKLPPVTEEVYNSKMAAASQEQEKGKSEKETVLLCTVCRKKYHSQNAFDSHLKSNKHLEKVAQLEEKKDGSTASVNVPKVVERKPKFMQVTPDMNGQEQPAELTEEQLIDERIKNARRLLPEECIFCLYKSEDLTSNVEHMAKAHGFFIPDIEYLKDLPGLIEYLGQKVSIGYVCLYCNGKGRTFNSMQAVQDHMREVSHCKILYDESDAGEYDNFYDFSRDWEGVASDAEDEEVSRSKFEISDDGTELIFPNGKSVGHRSLKIYYKQRVRPDDTRDALQINRLVQQYKALGWHDTGRSHLATQDLTIQRKRADHEMKLGVKANKLQRHIRKQTLQY